MFSFIIALCVVAAFIAFIYNKLVDGKNEIENSFAQIDVQLKRRYDLIPNLVEIAKKYMEHERQTLESVISARNHAISVAKAFSADKTNLQSGAALMAAESQLGGALGRLMATVEAYPELKADQTMSSLSEEISSTENRIGFARQAYNDSVMKFNNSVEKFPAVIFAGMFGFRKQSPLKSTRNTEEQEAVQVKF